MKQSWNIPGAPASFLSAVPLVAAAILALSFSRPPVRAQSAGEKTFASPGEAAAAVYTAVKKNDNAALNAIFGTQSARILHTGDDVSDRNALDRFVRNYEAMHRVVIEPDGTATLYVGAENWPMPIALAKNSNGLWYFDTNRGMQEMLYRRIGANEVDAIDVLHALVDAQKEYASAPRSGEKGKHYASHIISSEGKQDGLYWKTADNEPPSPIGPLLAEATQEGYKGKQDQPTPFHGYIYRILTRQGASAKGGLRDYMIGGQLTRGVAFVAYPAAYRNSGVMTFLVNQDDVVYEKDLGPDTAKMAAGITEFNPDSTWAPTE